MNSNMSADFRKNIDYYFTTITNNLGSDFISYLRNKMLDVSCFSANPNFRLELVVDTNILFQEVYSLRKNGTSFLVKIIDNPFLKLYAPPEIIKEINNKIDSKLPKEFDKSMAKADAKNFLNKISILESEGLKSWQDATRILGKRDEDDIPFLALNLSLSTHGIITKDKHLTSLQEIKTWNLKNTGKVLSDFNRGSFSFYITAASLPCILQSFYFIVVSFVKLLEEVVEFVIIIVTSLLKGAYEMLAQIPWPILVALLGAFFAALIFSGKFRGAINDFSLEMVKLIKEICVKIKDIFNAIVSFAKEIFEALKPFIEISWEMIKYLFLASTEMIERLNELAGLKVAQNSWNAIPSN